MLNNKKRAVLFAVITHAACSHAAFDQLGMSTYINNADISFLARNELPVQGLVYWSALDPVTDYPAALMPDQYSGAGRPGVNARSIPVPSALWFFGSALVALAVIQRRV